METRTFPYPSWKLANRVESWRSFHTNTCESGFEEGGLTFLSAIWTVARLSAAQTCAHSSDQAFCTQTFPILSERAAAVLATLQALE